MDNPYKKLLLVCDVAEQFIVDSKAPDVSGDTLKEILHCLLSAENILDKGRSVPPSDSSADIQEDRRAVNSRMEAIRSEIVVLMRRIGREDVETLLNSRANQARTEWLHNL